MRIELPAKQEFYICRKMGYLIGILVEKTLHEYFFYLKCFSMIIQGDMTLGTLITFYALLGYLVTPVKNLIELQPVIQSGLVAAEKMADILEMQPEETRGDIFTSIVAFELRNRESNSNIKREKSVIPYRKVPGLP